MRTLVLDEELVRLYAGALYAIARADGAVARDESEAVRELCARRWQLPVDPEALFFSAVTPEALAQAVARRDPFRGSGSAGPREIAHALVGDAVALSTTAGGLDEHKVEAILRFARALGCSADDLREAAGPLARWLA